MVRGCLIALFLWLALSVGYWYWLDHAFDPPGSIIGGLVVGLIVAGCIGTLINARIALRDWFLTAGARHDLPLADGRIVVVSGTIHPVGQPLIAPFSGKECVICEYDLGRSSRGSSANQTNSGADYAGFLMTPCVIRTRMGDVRLLGFPILEGYSDALCNGFDAASNAYRFLKGTEFENRTGLRMATLLAAFDDVWFDEDGLVQKNMRLGNVSVETLFPLELLENLAAKDEARMLSGDGNAAAPENEDETDEDYDEDDFDEDEKSDDDGPLMLGKSASAAVIPKMTEKRVPVGETVCAIGTYNEMQHGLLPKARGRTPNRLLRGSAEKVTKESRRSFISRLFGGLIVLLVANAAVYGAIQAYLHSPDTIQRRQQDAFQAVQNDDAAKLRKVLHRGLDPNLPDSNGRTLLSQATQLGRNELAEILRKAGAKQ